MFNFWHVKWKLNPCHYSGRAERPFVARVNAAKISCLNQSVSIVAALTAFRLTNIGWGELQVEGIAMLLMWYLWYWSIHFGWQYKTHAVITAFFTKKGLAQPVPNKRFWKFFLDGSWMDVMMSYVKNFWPNKQNNAAKQTIIKRSHILSFHLWTCKGQIQEKRQC